MKNAQKATAKGEGLGSLPLEEPRRSGGPYLGGVGIVQLLWVWESPSLAPGHQKGNPSPGAKKAALRLVRGQAWVSEMQRDRCRVPWVPKGAT